MNKKGFIYAIMVIVAVILQGCSLDTGSTEEITVDDLGHFNNNETSKDFVNAAYSSLQDLISDSWWGVTSLTTDNANKGSTPDDLYDDKKDLDELNIYASSPSIEYTWETLYQMINRANQAIKYIPELDEVDEELKERMLGEAKFLRALSYFYLVRMFGDVPLIDKVPENNEDNMTITRVSTTEVYDFILQDLQEAEEVLPSRKAYDEKEMSRASKGSAFGLLAKVYLYREDWQNAVDNASKVENLGDYRLLDNYAFNFRKEGDNSEESVFEVLSIAKEGNPNIYKYSRSQAPRGGNVNGYGFNMPSENLLDAFNTEEDYVRRDATIIFRDSELYDGRYVNDKVINPRSNYKAYSSDFTTDYYSDRGVKFLRYSEILLIKAEALNEMGQVNEAESYVNKVRKRVDLPEIYSLSQDEMRKAIWKERRLELAMEHDRWFDLMRINRLQPGYAEEHLARAGKDFVEGKHELMPIPSSFIDEVKDRGETIEQNPGY